MEKYSVEQYQKKIISLSKKIDCVYKKGSKLNGTNEELSLKYINLIAKWLVKLQTYRYEQGKIIDSAILNKLLGYYPSKYLSKFDTIYPVEYRLNQFREITSEKIKSFFEEYDKNKKHTDFINHITCDQETICEIKFEGVDIKELPNIEDCDQYIKIQKTIEDCNKKMNKIIADRDNKNLSREEDDLLIKEYREYYFKTRELQNEQEDVLKKFYNEK